MLVIGVLAFVLTAGSIAAFSYAIEFTEDHLVSENQYYSLRGYIDSDSREWESSPSPTE